MLGTTDLSKEIWMLMTNATVCESIIVNDSETGNTMHMEVY